MRRRLPSPALVIASIALFVALAGAGVAASVALVKSPKPIMLVPGSVSADGKVVGAHMKGGRVSEGVYTLTIIGATFAPNRTSASVNSVVSAKSWTVVKNTPPVCNVASEQLATNGSATAEVDCFSYNPTAGWQPADVPFDFQMVGPSR